MEENLNNINNNNINDNNMLIEMHPDKNIDEFSNLENQMAAYVQKIS